VGKLSDEQHTLVVLLASGVMLLFCMYLLVSVTLLKHDDALRLVPLFFTGFAAIEGYAAHFLHEPKRWAWAIALLFAGAACPLRDVFHVEGDWIMPIFTVLAAIALISKIGFPKNSGTKSDSDEPKS
jgi:hypothetical protein